MKISQLIRHSIVIFSFMSAFQIHAENNILCAETLDTSPLKFTERTTKNGILVKFVKGEIPVTGSNFKRYANFFDKRVKKNFNFVPLEFRPPQITVHIQGVSENAYNQVADHIMIPGQLVYKKWRKHWKSSGAAFDHELGHSIASLMFSYGNTKFARIWTKTVAFQKFYDQQTILSKEYGEKYTELYKKSEEIERQIDVTKEQELATGLKEQLDKLQLEMAPIERKLEEFEDKLQNYDAEGVDVFGTKVSESYNELISDVIAVMASSDSDGVMNPRAIYDSLYFTARHANEEYSSTKNDDNENRFRDFSKKVNIATFKGDDSHTLFNPVRNFLWEYVLSRPKFRHKKELVLRVLARSISARLEINYKQGDRSLDTKKDNELLINQIITDFKAADLPLW